MNFIFTRRKDGVEVRNVRCSLSLLELIVGTFSTSRMDQSLSPSLSTVWGGCFESAHLSTLWWRLTGVRYSCGEPRRINSSGEDSGRRSGSSHLYSRAWVVIFIITWLGYLPPPTPLSCWARWGHQTPVLCNKEMGSHVDSIQWLLLQLPLLLPLYHTAV